MSPGDWLSLVISAFPQVSVYFCLYFVPCYTSVSYVVVRWFRSLFISCNLCYPVPCYASVSSGVVRWFRSLFMSCYLCYPVPCYTSVSSGVVKWFRSLFISCYLCYPVPCYTNVSSGVVRWFRSLLSLLSSPLLCKRFCRESPNLLNVWTLKCENRSTRRHIIINNNK